jgi:hypothetical protein
MNDEDIDIGDGSIPSNVPSELLPYYTLNGSIPFRVTTYYNQTYFGTTAQMPTWTTETLEPFLQKIRQNFNSSRPIANYGKQPNDFSEDLAHYLDFQNKTVLVIGTEKPWLEALLLFLGAAHVTTLEYGKIHSEHPQITTLLPKDFRERYRTGKLQFDIVVSFSSLEHSGLGRYGDALNPWGDLLAVARAYCVTKPGGYLGLSLPSSEGDTVQFNGYRTYGQIRWPLLSTNWNQIDGDLQRTKFQYVTRKHNPYIFQKPNAL